MNRNWSNQKANPALKTKTGNGGRGRVGNVAVFQRSQSFDHLTAMSGVGSNPALATCETSQVLLAGVSGGFPGVLPFRPTYPLARLYERNNLERDIKLNPKKHRK